MFVPSEIDCSISPCTAVFPPLPEASSLAHHVGTGMLIYIAVGAVVWMVLESTGLVRAKLLDWQARGRRLSKFSFLLAMAFVILGWPKFVVAFVVGRLAR